MMQSVQLRSWKHLPIERWKILHPAFQASDKLCGKREPLTSRFKDSKRSLDNIRMVLIFCWKLALSDIIFFFFFLNSFCTRLSAGNLPPLIHALGDPSQDPTLIQTCVPSLRVRQLTIWATTPPPRDKLVKASLTDKFWGIGIYMFSKDIMQKKNCVPKTC